MKALTRRATRITFLCLVLLSTSCAEFNVQVPVTNDPNSNVPIPATDFVGNKTTCSFFWGLIADPPAIVDQKTECGMQDVRVTRDFWQGLCTLLTLGAVNPMNIQWKLQSAPVQEGSIPTTLPPSKKASPKNP